jgi:hypothetical protein
MFGESWPAVPSRNSTGARAALAAELFRLKRNSGYSFSALARKTSYSRSSLQRYVNGVQLPTADAVRAIGDACDGEQALLLSLWAAAAEHDSRAHPAPHAPPEAKVCGRQSPSPSPKSIERLAATLAAFVLGIVVGRWILR